MSRVFISYRRGDASQLAGDIRRCLSAVIPDVAIFLDLQTIQPGDDFSDTIFRNIESADLFILLVSPSWIASIQDSNRTTEDWVKMEVETALRLGKVIIPVVADSGESFYELELPKSISRLKSFNCIELQPEPERALDRIKDEAIKRLEKARQQRLKTLAAKISKSTGAILHTWEAVRKASQTKPSTEPGAEEIWEAVILLAKEKYGERKWRRVLRNFRLEQSEDLGLIIFACIIEGFFMSSPADDPSDYWGLGHINDHD